MSDIQVNSYSYSEGEAEKKAQEESFLESIRTKKQEEKTQVEQLQKVQELDKLDQDQSAKKIQQENQQEFKALEQVSKTAKTEVEKLSPEQLKTSIPELKKAEAEIIQKILQSNKLEQLQQKYKQAKLEEAGVKQKFSEEYKVLDEISKALKVPVDQLKPEDIRKYLKSQEKNKIFEPKQAGKKESETSSKILSEKDSQIKQEMESKYGKLKDLLASLKQKQKNIQSDAKDQNSAHKDLKVINKQIGTLEQKLSLLKTELKEIKSKEQADTNAKPKTDSFKETAGKIRQELAKVKDSIGKDKLQEVLSRVKNLKELKTSKQTEDSKQVEDRKAGSLKDAKKVEQEVGTVSDKLGALKNKRKSIQKQLAGKEAKNPSNRVVENKINELKSNQNDLKAKLIVDKEIREISSKDAKKAEADTKQSIKQIDQDIKQLQSMKGSGSIKELSTQLKNLQNEALAKNIMKELKQETKKDELINKILKTENPDLSIKEIKLLGDINTKHLSLKQLQKFAGVLNKYSKRVETKLEDTINTGKVKNMDFDSRLEYAQNKHSLRFKFVDVMKQIKNQKQIKELISGERERIETEKPVDAKAPLVAAESKLSETKESKGIFDDYVDNLLEEFDDLKDDESTAKFIVKLRQLFKNNPQEFRAIAKSLIQKGKIDEKLLEEELGILVGSKQGSLKMEAVKPEALQSLQAILDMTPAEMAGDENLQKIIDKGRISRKQFEKYYAKDVSASAWDYGLISANTSSIGMLKERVELNSFIKFSALMSKMTGGGSDEDAKELSELFLTKNDFTPDERDLISLFIKEYEDQFVDPESHMHGFYNTYLKEKTYSQLEESTREELVIAVLLKLVKDMKTENKHEMFNSLMSFSRMDIKSQEFYRSVHVLEYYFISGKAVKPDYLDLKNELRLIEETTYWDEDQEKAFSMSMFSELVTKVKKPEKKVPKIKLRSMADRMKSKMKKP